MALTHTVLMHVPAPERAVSEMLQVTRPGGLVITCEANRDAHTAMLRPEERVQWKAGLTGLGIPDRGSDAEIERELDEDFLTKGRAYHTVHTTFLPGRSGGFDECGHLRPTGHLQGTGPSPATDSVTSTD